MPSVANNHLSHMKQLLLVLSLAAFLAACSKPSALPAAPAPSQETAQQGEESSAPESVTASSEQPAEEKKEFRF